MGRKHMPSMDMPKHWLFGVSNALTLPMQRHLWSAYSDLVAVAEPDTCPPASKTWTLTLGRRVFASDEAGSSSANTDAGTRGTNVTPGTLQHRASSPAARAAALRFMATLDLLLGGAGEGRGRIEPGPFTPAERTPSPAAAWGGWGGKGDLFGSPRDMCARVDFSALHTARIMQCVPGADGKQEIDPAEIEAAADAVRARCGVRPDTDIMPFRLGGLGTCVTIEVGSDDDMRMPEGYDEGYAFYINLRPPNHPGHLEFHMSLLNMTIQLAAGDLLGLRSAVQPHSIRDGPEPEPVKKTKKKKNKKKKKKPAAGAAVAEAEEAEADDDSDVEDITNAMGGSSIAGPSAGPSRAGPSANGAHASSSAASSSAGPSAAGPSSSSWTSSAAGSSSAGPSSHASASASGSKKPIRIAPSVDAGSSTAGPSRSTTMARSTPPPAAAINFSAMPRVLITVWTDIETVANVAMAAKMVWPELKIAGIESPPPSPELSASSGKRPYRM